MSCNCPLGNRKPQPCTAFSTSPSFVYPIEPLEDSVSQFNRNAGAAVMNLDHGTLLVVRYVHQNAAIDGRVFHCVVDEIHECLPQDGAVRPYNDRTVAIDSQPLSFFFS